MTWGYGEVLMHKKYKAHYEKQEGELIRDYRNFVRLVIGKIPAMLHNKLISKNELRYQDKKLDHDRNGRAKNREDQGIHPREGILYIKFGDGIPKGKIEPGESQYVARHKRIMITTATNGAELLCNRLESLGVRHVFGIPGTQSVVLYDALQRSNIRSVLSTHELSASFMANGYYRASGKIAPLVTIPGPGFTYALTGLAEALHDSAALLHIVGLPAGKSGKKYVFQALDQEVVAGPLVKGVYSIRRGGPDPPNGRGGVRSCLLRRARPRPAPMVQGSPFILSHDPGGEFFIRKNR